MGFFSNSDKRRGDGSLKTDIDMEEMDTLDLEDPFGGSDGVQDPGGRSPATATRKYVTEGVKGMAEGAMSVVGEEVERNMPNVAAVTSELKEGYEDFQELKGEIQKQIQPMVVSLENTTRKILPKVKKFMPNAWYNKAMGKLDERAAARAGEASEDRSQQQADMISAELNAIFGQQAERDKQQDFEENKNRLIDRAVASTRHRDTQHALIRLYDSVRSTELFHRTLHTAYMKKSLELKYKQLFVQQDTHNLIARSFSAFETYFKAIAKNTALPDVMKTQASDYIKKSRTEKYGTMMSEYLSKARSIMFNKIKDSVKNALDGIGMGVEMAGQGADMIEMMDQMGEENPLKMMIARGIGSLAGRAAAGGPVSRLFQKFAPWATAINGNLKNAKTRAYMSMNELRNRWSTGSWWQQMLADFLPTVSTGSTTGSNDLLTKSEEAAPFDKLTRQSIVEIIPGYLSNIWHSIEKMRNGNEDIEQRVYNIYERDFTSKSELQKSIYSDPRMFGGTAGQSGAVGEALAVLRAGNTRKNPESTEDLTKGIEDAISRIITNHYLTDSRFNPVFIKQFLNATDDAQVGQGVNEYIENISRGIEPEEFGRCCRVIVDYLTDKDGEFDNRLVKRFQDAIYTAMTQSDGFKAQAPMILENFGYRHILSKRYGGADWLIDKDNMINQDILGRKLSEFELESARQTSDWDKRSTDEYLKASDYVGVKTAEYKQAYKESAFGKWVDRTVRSGKDAVTSAKGTVSGAASDLAIYVTKTRVDSKLAKLMDPNANPEELTEAVDDANKLLESLKKANPKEYEGYKKRIDEAVSALRKKDATAANRLAAAVEKIDALQVEAKKPEEGKTEGTAAAEGGETTSRKSIWSRIKSAAKTAYDRVTSVQSEEDIDKLVDKTKTDLENLLKKRPKNYQEAKTMLLEIMAKEEKEHPEAARKIRDAIADLDKKYQAAMNSRLGKTMSAWSGWSRKHAEALYQDTKSKATQWYDTYGKPIVDPYIKKIQPWIDAAILQGSEMGTEVVQLIRANPEAWERLKRNCDAKYTAFMEAAPTHIKDAIARIQKEGEKAAAAVTGDLKAFHSATHGTDIPPPPPPTSSVPLGDTESVGGPSGELMDLLRAWKEESSDASATVIDLLSKLSETIANGIPTTGGGTTIIERRRYGIFGAAGHAIAKGSAAVTKAAWRGLKGLGGIYTGTYKLGLRGLTSAVGGISKVAGWATNQIGLTPYVDIYVKGQSTHKPIVTWRQQAFAPGIVYGEKDGDGWKPSEKRVEASRKIDRPCFDPRNGNMVISEDDIKAGLITSDGSVLGSIGRLANTIASGLFNITNTGVKGFWNAIGIAAKGVFGWGGEQEKYVDIYRKDEIGGGYQPILTRLKQKRRPGVVFANKKRVERSSDIHEPVYDPVTGEELISKDDIQHGLVGVDNKPIGSGNGGFHDGLLQGGMKLGNTIARGLFGKTAMKIVGGAAVGLGAIYKGMWETIFGAGKAVTSGVSKLGARLFGFDTREGFGSKAISAITTRQDGTNSRLDKLTDIVSAILQSIQAMSAGGGGGGPGGITGAGKQAFKGRKGKWKNGKFIPDPNGTEWEFPKGIDPQEYIAKLASAGGVAGVAAAAGSEDVDRTIGSERAGRGKAATPNAAPDYDRSDDMPDTGGGDGGGMSLMDMLIMSQFLPKRLRRFLARQMKKLKTLPKRILRHTFRALRHPIKSARAVKRLAKLKVHKAAKFIKSIPKAVKGAKAALKTAKVAAKAAYAAKMAKNAKTVARMAKVGKTAGKLGKLAKAGRLMKFGKFGRIAALGVGAAAGLKAMKGGAEAAKGLDLTVKAAHGATEAGAKAAEKTAGFLGKFKGLLTKGGSDAAKAGTEAAVKAGEAAAKTGEAVAAKQPGVLSKMGGKVKDWFKFGKHAKDAATGATAATAGATTAAAAGAGKAGEKALEKVAEKAGEQVAEKGAGKTLGKVGKVAGVALDALFAGDAANEARHNAEEILGKRHVTDTDRDVVAQGAALNSMGSDIIGGVGALAGMMGIESGDKLAAAVDEFNSNAAKASAELGNEVGNVHFGTDLASKADAWVGNMEDIPWYRLDKMAVKGGARAVDGVTNVTSGLTDGAWKVVAGGAKAGWMSLKNWWNEDDVEEQHRKVQQRLEQQNRATTSAADAAYKGTPLENLDPVKKKAQFLKDWREFKIAKHPEIRKTRSDAAKAFSDEVDKVGGFWNTKIGKTEFTSWLKTKYGVQTEDKSSEATPDTSGAASGQTRLQRLDELGRLLRKGTLTPEQKKELSELGVDFPDDPDEWLHARKQLQLEEKAALVSSSAKKAGVIPDQAKQTPTSEEPGTAKPVLKPETAAKPTGQTRAQRLDELHRSYKTGKLDAAAKKELSELGVDFPDDPDEWIQARNQIRLEEKAALSTPSKQSTPVPKVDQSQLVVHDTAKSPTRTTAALHAAKREEDKRARTAATNAITASSDQTAALLKEQAARMEALSSNMTKYMNEMNRNFGSVFTADGMRVVGIDTLTAVTAAKRESGPTIINNNQITQMQDMGLDLRKLQL